MKRILMQILLCVLVSTAHATTHHEPAYCPSLVALEAQPFSDVYYSPDSRSYQPYRVDQYDTDERWLFAVFVDNVKESDEALNLANTYLSTLYGHPVPIQDGKGGYTCLYMTDYGFAFTTTPPVIGNISHLTL